MDATDEPGTVAEWALEERRARVRRYVEAAREARALATDPRPAGALVVTAMYATIALAWTITVIAMPQHRGIGGLGGLGGSIAVYATLLAAGAWRLRVAEGGNPRSTTAVVGAFTHAAVGLGGTLVLVGPVLLGPVLSGLHPRGVAAEVLWGPVVLAVHGMVFGVVPVAFTVATTRRGGLLLIASLLGPALLFFGIPISSGVA